MDIGRSSVEEGGRGLRDGHRRHRRGEGGERYHPDGRQLHVDREGRQVGPQRVRLDRQVPPVPAHRQRGRRHHGLRWLLHYFCMRLRVIAFTLLLSE